MALTATARANAKSTSGSSVTTSSFTPSNNSLLVAVYYAQRYDTATPSPAITGGDLTWTLRASHI